MTGTGSARPMSALDKARAHFEEGAFGKAHEAASAGPRRAPDDVELLRLAGRAGVELGSDDAVDQLRKVTELRPDSAESWRDLADALAAEGRTGEASEAFRKVLEIEPEDEVALTALGHTAFQEGKRDDAVSMLERVAGRGRGGSSAAISLVDMYRYARQPEDALAAARRVAEADAGLPARRTRRRRAGARDGNLDEAADAFARARTCSRRPTTRSPRCRRDQGGAGARTAERALELARQASAIDSLGRTAGVLAHLEVELGAEGTPEEAVARGATTMFIQAQEPPPSRAEVEALLDATLADLRRGLLGEDRREDGGGPWLRSSHPAAPCRPMAALPVVRGVRLPQAPQAQPGRLPRVQPPLPPAAARAARPALRRGLLRGAVWRPRADRRPLVRGLEGLSRADRRGPEEVRRQVGALYGTGDLDG